MAAPVSNSLIIDLGTYEIQIGIAGEDEPKVVEPAIYADSDDPILSESVVHGLAEMARERFFGKDAIRFKNLLKLHYFLQEKDFTTFGLMLKQIFEKNYWDPKDFNIIIIGSSRLSGKIREQLLSLLFHKLKTPRIAIIPSSLCVLSALGVDTGLIVDIGHFSTGIEGVFKGFPNEESIFEIPIGGYHITQYLLDLIFSRIQYQSTMPLYWVAEDIKRAAAFTVMNPNQEMQLIKQGKTDYDQEVELPDGTKIIINSERFNCIEPFFQPDLIHLRVENIIESIDKSIRAWERHQIPELVQKIILCGNGAKIPNLIERITELLKEKFAKTLNVKVVSLPEYKKGFWIGASILYAKRNGQLEWINNPEMKEG